MQIKIRYPNGQVVHFSQFTSSNKISNDALEENAGTVMGSALVSFQIEGCGAPRGKELLRMHRHDILCSAGVLHYETVTGKPKATVRSFQRKLSPKSSRLVAIVMNLYERGENNLLFDLHYKDAAPLIGEIWRRIFGFDRKVGFLESRQIVACHLNQMEIAHPSYNFQELGKVCACMLYDACQFHSILYMHLTYTVFLLSYVQLNHIYIISASSTEISGCWNAAQPTYSSQALSKSSLGSIWKCFQFVSSISWRRS